MYERLKPKLEPNSKSLIEKNKLDFQERKKGVLNTKNSKTRLKSVGNGSEKITNNLEDNLMTSFNDISRRSSLKSSLIDITRNESFESDNADIPPR